MAKSFGFESTTDEVLEEIDLSGKRVVVTGVSAGLGVETARALVAHGATVVGTARDLVKAGRALAEAVPQQASNPTRRAGSNRLPCIGIPGTNLDEIVPRVLSLIIRNDVNVSINDHDGSPFHCVETRRWWTLLYQELAGPVGFVPHFMQNRESARLS